MLRCGTLLQHSLGGQEAQKCLCRTKSNFEPGRLQSAVWIMILSLTSCYYKVSDLSDLLVILNPFFFLRDVAHRSPLYMSVATSFLLVLITSLIKKETLYLRPMHEDVRGPEDKSMCSLQAIFCETQSYQQSVHNSAHFF